MHLYKLLHTKYRVHMCMWVPEVILAQFDSHRSSGLALDGRPEARRELSEASRACDEGGTRRC